MTVKELITQGLQGQGSMVDIGGVLPKILNGINDRLQSGYLFWGFYECNEVSEIPPAPNDGKYFCICLVSEDGDYRYWCFVFNNGVNNAWKIDDNSYVYIYDTAEFIVDNAGESDGYVTPRGLVQYVPTAIKMIDISQWPTGYFGDPNIDGAIHVTESQFHDLLECSILKRNGVLFPAIAPHNKLLEVFPEQTEMDAIIHAFWGAYSLGRDWETKDVYFDGCVGWALMGLNGDYGLVYLSM